MRDYTLEEKEAFVKGKKTRLPAMRIPIETCAVKDGEIVDVATTHGRCSERSCMRR